MTAAAERTLWVELVGLLRYEINRYKAIAQCYRVDVDAGAGARQAAAKIAELRVALGLDEAGADVRNGATSEPSRG